MARRNNYYEQKSPEVYWQDKLKYHIQKLKYEIKKLKELGIDVNIDALCNELKGQN